MAAIEGLDWVGKAAVGLQLPVFDLSMAIIMAATAFPFLHLGKEFMPPLNEGDILFSGGAFRKVKGIQFMTEVLSADYSFCLPLYASNHKALSVLNSGS